MRIDPFRPFDRYSDRRKAQVRAQVRAKARARAATAEDLEEVARTPIDLPAPMVSGPEEQQPGYGFYRPDAAFLAHLIAMRDLDVLTLKARPEEALDGVLSYRSVAASPRRRAPGHVISTQL